MITTKTLPLVLKAATATMPASVVGQRPTIAMVTAINSQKAVLSTDVQNTPVNLQTSSKVTGPGAEAVQIVAKNTVTLVSQQLLLMCAHMRGFRICICWVISMLRSCWIFQSPSVFCHTKLTLWGWRGNMAFLLSIGASLVAQTVKNILAMQKTWVQSLGWEDALRRAWQPTLVFEASLVAQTVQSLQCGKPRFNPWVGQIPWRRKWKPTLVFLPGKSHELRSLAAYSQ